MVGPPKNGTQIVKKVYKDGIVVFIIKTVNKMAHDYHDQKYLHNHDFSR